jgi:hypothetical protein
VKLIDGGEQKAVGQRCPTAFVTEQSGMLIVRVEGGWSRERGSPR